MMCLKVTNFHLKSKCFLEISEIKKNSMIYIFYKSIIFNLTYCIYQKILKSEDGCCSECLLILAYLCFKQPVIF